MPARRQIPLTDAAPTPEPVSGKSSARLEALNGFLQIGQFAAMTFGQFADAGAIGLHGPGLVNEVNNLANTNSAVAKRLDLLIEVGPYAGVITAGLPFVAQILVNHGIFKAEAFATAGVVHPDTLAAQMRTQMMQQAEQAMRMQAEAEMRLEEQRLAMQEMADAREERAEANSNGE